MNKLLRPQLMNGSFGDPLVYCRIAYAGRAFTFDMGASFDLVNRDLMRVDDVYLSHAHMDHVFGFEHFLRANLKQHRSIRIFGPSGIHKVMQGKLRGFTWNLVHGYRLSFDIHEISRSKLTVYRAKSNEGFRMEKIRQRELKKRPTHQVQKTEYYTLTTAALDHRITSQAYAATENIMVSINKDALQSRGWVPGPWLETLKTLAIKGRGDGDTMEVPRRVKGKTGKPARIPVADLKQQLILPRKRNRIAYVTDTLFSARNREAILELADGADQFFCETPFLDQDQAKAEESYHLTAKQAGTLAREAGVHQLVVFHFSKKYLHDPYALIEEASQAFGKKVVAYPTFEPYHASRHLARA